MVWALIRLRCLDRQGERQAHSDHHAGRNHPHRLDVVLTNVPLVRDNATPWVAHKIAEQPVSIIGPPSYATDKRPLHALLAEEPLIVPTPQTSIRSSFDAMADRLDVKPNIVAEADDMAMLRLIARERRALAILPPIVVHDELLTGALVEVLRLPDLVESFHAVTLKRRFPNPLLRELLLHESDRRS